MKIIKTHKQNNFIQIYLTIKRILFTFQIKQGKVIKLSYINIVIANNQLKDKSPAENIIVNYNPEYLARNRRTVASN